MATVGGHRVTVWFAPSRPAGGDYPDLAGARWRIEDAAQGILFRMFMPGTQGTLLQTIQGLAAGRPGLYVRGVLNQDPGTAAHPTVGLFHRSGWHTTNMDIVLPAAIAAPFASWRQELLKLGTAHSMVHSI